VVRITWLDPSHQESRLPLIEILTQTQSPSSMGAKAQGSQGPAPGILGAEQSPWKHAPSLLGTCGGLSVHTSEGLQSVQVLVVAAVHTGLQRERDCIFQVYT
jgi:hypothetical protein